MKFNRIWNGRRSMSEASQVTDNYLVGLAADETGARGQE
jgi:hypothetical protein